MLLHSRMSPLFHIRIFLFLSLSGATLLKAGPIVVPDATALRLSLSEPLSSATNNVDDPVRFEVTEEVKVGEVVVVPRGATAVGHVVEVEPRKRMGRAGKLNFSIDHVKAVDGTNVRLRASTTRKGDDKSGTVIVGTLMISPLFLIMRGKDIEIPRGSSLVAYVDGDREVNAGGSGPSAAEKFREAPRSTVGPQLAAKLGEEKKPADPSTAVVKSEPDGADITIDGKFLGNTPSTVQLSPGDHMILIQKSGLKSWTRTITVTPGGIVTLNAVLEK